MDEGRKSVILIAASILAARRLAQLGERPKSAQQCTIELANARFDDCEIDKDILKSQEGSNLNMRYGNRDKPERKSGRVGFVEGRLDELRRRLENATDERQKSELSEQIREWQSFRPERSAPSAGRR
jgi:hypothetical protein